MAGLGNSVHSGHFQNDAQISLNLDLALWALHTQSRLFSDRYGRQR
jgi:hypothetical protein